MTPLTQYEVEVEGSTRHFVAFIAPELAQARGLDSASLVGEFTPGPDGGFDVRTFRLNSGFSAALVRYMNEEASRLPEIAAEARAHRGGWLFLIDPRHPDDPNAAPPDGDVLGGFAVDDAGGIVPDSFRYNPHHRLFDPDSGESGLFADSRFYDWLHRLPEHQQ
ncbi:MAG TPA: hypothetical protein VF590_18345 [Isosphaeraceae bacterium]|jgi:hypothetical protein